MIHIAGIMATVHGIVPGTAPGTEATGTVTITVSMMVTTATAVTTAPTTTITEATIISVTGETCHMERYITGTVIAAAPILTVVHPEMQVPARGITV